MENNATLPGPYHHRDNRFISLGGHHMITTHIRSQSRLVLMSLEAKKNKGSKQPLQLAPRWPQTRLASTTVCPGHRYRLMPRQHNPVSTSTNFLISRGHCGNLNSAEVISDILSDRQTQVVDEEFCLVA